MNAVNAAIEAIAKGRDRILLVMATGTGKTYTAFQIIWWLWAGRKKRILFIDPPCHETMTAWSIVHKNSARKSPTA